MKHSCGWNGRLMPWPPYSNASVPARLKAEELVMQAMNNFNTDRVIDVMEPVIEGMAAFFGVSKQAAKIAYDIDMKKLPYLYLFRWPLY